MPNVVSDIKQWAKTLPYWEQVALDKILSGQRLTETDYDNLLQFLLEDNDLMDKVSTRSAFHVLDKENGGTVSNAGMLRIDKICNVKNVNALVEGQTLEFSPNLTTIFGANGSGKSGYARVLGCAGFSRGDREVLPDLTRPYDEALVLSAEIEIFEGTVGRCIPYQVGKRLPELSQCYVFDSSSVRVHLRESNEFSFSPAGLSALTDLSEVTDIVRARLDSKIALQNEPNRFILSFQEESHIKELIGQLSSRTNLDELKQLATFSDNEKKRIVELRKSIAELEAKNIIEEITKINSKTSDLLELKKKIEDITHVFTEKSIEQVRTAITNVEEKQQYAQQLSVNQFQNEKLTQIGSDLWHQFVESAKTLAEAEGSEGSQYPQTNDICLLCHQQLSEEARLLIRSLWEYLESDAQSQLNKAETELQSLTYNISVVDLSFFSEQSIYWRLIQELEPSMTISIHDYLEKCKQWVSQVVSATDIESLGKLPALPANGITALDKLVQALRAKVATLQTEDQSEKLTQLKQELLVFQHRELLRNNISEIEKFVNNKKWIVSATKVKGDTKHITSKYKVLFNQLVTDKYLEIFTGLLNDLKRPMRVKIATAGKKGRTFKQIALAVDEKVPPDIAVPDKMLSEGEKRAVALADFLAEAALDTQSRTIVLDDPVTSLDLEWRQLIANKLVEEAKNRQVIIFTHDLPFLYYLKQGADKLAIPIMCHWIQRVGDKPGYVSLNNSPALEGDYRKLTIPQSYLTRAKACLGKEQEETLRLGFDALRTCYEAFVIFDLFNEVVTRFGERISMGRLKQIKWDDQIVSEAMTKHELLSSYIGGHLHTDGLSPLSDPEYLSKEIQAFVELKNELKQLKKPA